MKKPILIAIAHSSYFVPQEIRRRMILSDFEIQNCSDPYTDKIFDIKGCHIVKAGISRLVCDVNRAPDDIEVESELCSEGVVVRINEDAKPVYSEPPTPESIHKRIVTYHDSFHTEIDSLIEKVKFVIDGHSMRSIGPATKHDAGQPRADICLGNRGYSTCSSAIMRFFQDAFKDFRYSVAINTPYSGAFILGCHCSRRRNPGIQIEINRKLYLGENTLKPLKGKIKELNQRLTEILERLVEKL